MLPLLPVLGLEYSPVHFPASDARSPASPERVTGVGFVAQAITTPATKRSNLGRTFTDPPVVDVRRRGGNPWCRAAPRPPPVDELRIRVRFSRKNFPEVGPLIAPVSGA